MKNFSIILTVFSVFSVFSCKEQFSYFNGEIVFVEPPSSIDTLQGKQIELDGIYTGAIDVYDSLMFFGILNYPDYWEVVFDMKTGKHINSLCRKGNGPGEFIQANFWGQFEKETNLCMWIHDWGRNRCVLVDATNNSQKKIINLSGLKNERMYQITWVNVLNDSLLLTYNQGEELFDSGTDFSPPLFRIFNYSTNEELVRYEIFNGFSHNEQTDPQSCLFGNHKIKPDRTKLTMAMENLHQMNILDLQTGEVTGYRRKGTPDFDILRAGSYSELITYYSWVCADNDLIYAMLPGNQNTVMDVFDWDGNLKKGLVLDKVSERIALDPVNKYLYTIVIGEDDEEVYRYDVSYLYK